MRLELVLAVGIVLAAPAAHAARAVTKPDPLERAPKAEMPAKNTGLNRSVPADAPPSRTERTLLQPGEVVDASEALDEMIDELVADLTRLGPARVSPLLLERVQVSENMNPQFATILEGRIATAVLHAGGFGVVRCAECWAVHGQVQDGAFVVARGVNSREELQVLATKYGAKAFLTASLSMENRPVDSLALDVEIVGVSGEVLYAESMRVSGRNAMLYRAVDTSQIRQARLDELERKLNQRPSWGTSLMFGAMMVPSTDAGGNYWGPYGQVFFNEIFGDERQYRFGIGIGGFISGKRFPAALLGVGLLARTHKENLNRPSFFLGGTAGALTTGGGGETFYLGVRAEYVLGIRLALHGGLNYVVPFKLGGSSLPNAPTVGGIAPQIGAGFVW